MSKKHVAISIIGASLLTIGTIGGIWSGINTMPKVINDIQVEVNKQSQEEVIYNSTQNIDKLNINLTQSHVVIKKHDKQNIIVERSGNKEISTITTENNNNELIIKEERNKINRETKNIDDIVRYFISEMYSPYNSQVTIYLPEKVDVDIKTDYNSVSVNDDVILNTLNYETYSGNIVLDSKVNFENLNIKSDTNISLGVDEISGIKNINIISNSVNIHEGTSIVNEEDIPENMEIKTTNKNYDDYDVIIESNIPVAKNLVVDSTSRVKIGLPIVDYKFNFDVYTSRYIDFEADDEKYYNTPLEKYFVDDNKTLLKEFNGLINQGLSQNKNEYFVKIRSSNVIFE